MTERITRVGADELRYEITMNDPKTYTKPFTISLPLMSPPGYQLLPYECHEGDYAVPNALSAERVRGSGARGGPEEGHRPRPPRGHAGKRQRAGDRPAQRWRMRC